MTFKQIQDGGRTPYWKSFLAISRRYIGRSMRNLDWRWRITCRYRPHDKNGNFQNFKMADGRHFENSFVSISQPWIIRFLSNLVWRCECPFRRLKFAKNSKFCKFKMADGRHVENRFLAISRRHIGRSTRNLEHRWRITCRYRSVTKAAIFADSRWRTAAILKIALSPYLSRELSYFDQIWYTDANFHSEHWKLTKIDFFFQIQDGGRTPYWKWYFGFISAPYWPIYANFGMDMTNHVQI